MRACLCRLALCFLVLGLALPARSEPRAARPAPADESLASLRAVQAELLAAHGRDVRRVPLHVKADHYDWQLWRYHWTPYRQVHPDVRLPLEPGEPAVPLYGADVSTWNGALLAALSYRYAVTGNRATAERIAALVEGLRFFQEVTGIPGLAARCVLQTEEPVHKARLRYVDAEGTVYHYRADPAKGTYAQLVMGYAVLLMHAADALSEADRRRAREDLAALVDHVVAHGYRIAGRDGEPTRYGNLDPLWLGVAIPFNAQVMTAMVASAHRFPPQDAERRGRFAREFERLRAEHPYYRSFWTSPFLRPQRVARIWLLDANDLNHVTNAAFVALALELDAARRTGRAPDSRVLYRLGRTLYHARERLRETRQSLASFMWAGLLRDPRVFAAIVPEEREKVEAELGPLLRAAVEQLRRFPIDRVRWQGREREADGPQWVDAYRPDNYHWKVEPDRRWEVTGPPTRLLTAAIDYLHAYWLLRFYGLDAHPAVRARHAEVLGPAVGPAPAASGAGAGGGG